MKCTVNCVYEELNESSARYRCREGQTCFSRISTSMASATLFSSLQQSSDIIHWPATLIFSLSFPFLSFFYRSSAVFGLDRQDYSSSVRVTTTCLLGRAVVFRSWKPYPLLDLTAIPSQDRKHIRFHQVANYSISHLNPLKISKCCRVSRTWHGQLLEDSIFGNIG